MCLWFFSPYFDSSSLLLLSFFVRDIAAQLQTQPSFRNWVNETIKSTFDSFCWRQLSTFPTKCERWRCAALMDPSVVCFVFFSFYFRSCFQIEHSFKSPWWNWECLDRGNTEGSCPFNSTSDGQVLNSVFSEGSKHTPLWGSEFFWCWCSVFGWFRWIFLEEGGRYDKDVKCQLLSRSTRKHKHICWLI